MNISFRDKRTTIVVTPVDMRGGFPKLCSVALLQVGINVMEGNDIVIFFNSSRAICKVITADAQGTLLVVRRLHRGRFEQLLMREDGEAKMEVEIEDLEKVLDGGKIYVKRTNYLAG